MLLSLGQWGSRWAVETPPVRFEHSCGETLELVHTCKACGEAVTGGRDVKRESAATEWTPAA